MHSKFGRWLTWSIYIHGQLYDHQTDLSAVKYQANKMINSIFFFQNETSSRSASGANLKIMSLQGGGGGVTPPGYSRVWVKRIGKMVDIKRARMMCFSFLWQTSFHSQTKDFLDVDEILPVTKFEGYLFSFSSLTALLTASQLCRHFRRGHSPFVRILRILADYQFS